MLIGGGLAVYGVVNLAEGYGNDNPGAKSQGMKQLMAGGALGLIGLALPTALQAIISEAGIS
ncbi:MAG: Maff2 family protein [Defluviitaleaceae bacterium]|nr:Maff2 family protein [Defluviitaleaceae bacterium]